jgi:uncharacterized protein YggU (UPF0235/DUF167 family)
MRKIYIKVIVKTNRKKFSIILNKDLSKQNIDCYIMETTTVPINNSCNKEIIPHLAKYFNIYKKNITIKSGEKSSNKYIEIKK